MRIVNNTTKILHLGFLPPNGRSVSPNGGYIFTSDEYATHPAVQSLVAASSITIDSFAVNDNYATGNNFRNVSSYEANLFFGGLYRIPDTWASEGTVEASAGATYLTSTEIGEVLNTRNRNIIQFTVPNCEDTIKVILTEGTLSLSSVVDALNADATFTKYLLAEIYDTTYLKISTKAKGENADLAIAGSTEFKSAASLLGLTGATKTSDIKTVATVTMQVLGTTGQGIYGSQQVLKLKTLAADGVDCTEFVMQVMDPRKGTVVSGNYSNTLTVKSGDQGVIEFEVIAPSTITTECHVTTVTPDSHAWAIVPSTRLEVVGS